MRLDNFIGIIPARYLSSRFPGKPLCDICGKTMIKRTYDSVMEWNSWDKVYVATDDVHIQKSCETDNIPVIMTSPDHSDCLDRAAEVTKILEDKNKGASKYIVIQGDEPLFNINTLYDVDLSPNIINFYTEIKDEREMYDSNVVKIVVSKSDRALYFSRYSIPYHGKKTTRKGATPFILKQIGVYVFTGEMLRLYSFLKSTYLEDIEGIGLNRLLSNDIDIHMRYTMYDSISVDTPGDRDRIIEILKKSCNN